MRKLAMIDYAITVALGLTITAHGAVICSGESAAVHVKTPVSSSVNKSLIIYASPCTGKDESVTVAIDGTCAFSTTTQSETAWRWQPLTKGNHTLTCTFGTNVLTKTLNVTALDFFVQPLPNPPMSKDNNVSITPTTRNFGVSGGGNAILVSGSSATWTAAVSDQWITLNTTSGNVGYPVAYTVSANTNVEQRTGYVYVSGWVHTVTQDGVGGTISPENREIEHQGGSGTIAVSAANKMVWQARPNVDWLSVTPTSGAGEGSVTYQVAPYNEVATRQGTLTVAGNTFTVFQYGRRMKLSTYNETRNYETHVIPITVNALAITQWSVTPNNSWISVVDAGNGQGGDLVTIAIAENPSYKARTGTVTIGTETFTVTQQGRPTAALSFSVSPTASTASVNGANGTIAVTATPDLPWTATSGANWITVYAATATGSGNGNVVYSASPNPTLSQRTGTVTVTPEAASGMSAKTHRVTQPAAQSALSSNGYEFEASGESCSVEVSVANIVQWSISESLDWITVNGSTSRTGPGTVVLQAAANDTVYPRSGTVTIAGKTFSVSQKARGVELEYDTKLFDTDGGYESISIHPDGNSAWTAVASDPSWITIFQGDSGTGDGEILYIVAPYVGDGTARTGWITVGDKKVYITQRAYDLNISPNGSVVKGNNGDGEFAVAADIGAVWTAIVTEPWITLVSGYDAGTGSGTVRFICEDNNTGKTRVGKIVVAGEVYTVTQSARILVRVQATAGHGGSLTGSGTYDKGIRITLTAVPDEGYRFVRWTGPVESTENPLTMDADELTGIRAEFEPLPVEFTAAQSSLDGVDLSWNTLAWATTYRLHRGTSDDLSAAETLTTLPGGTDAYRDGTGERGVTYWYWVEAVGEEDDVVSGPTNGMKRPIVNSSITYTNLKGATHSNPDTYVEGRTVAFTHPSAVTGYAFAGWTPSQITEDMTGAQTVRAEWTANRYSIIYNANGGTGTMPPVDATYDVEVAAAANGFSLEGHSFAGWATNASDAAVAFIPGQPMTNLTDVADGEFNLYAVWNVNSYMIAFDANGGEGGEVVTQDYGTVLSAPTVTREGYTFNGWSPSVPATVPAGNATYTAQWTVNQYRVTFDANGGTGGKTVTQDYGTALTAPSVSRTGYTFTGWSPSVPSTVTAGNVTYTAQWKVNQYTVTFNANGGVGGKTVTQDYGTALAAPTVTREGYTFNGWSPSVSTTVPADNTTYTAQWVANQYTVTFDANGGTGDMLDQAFTYDEAAELRAAEFTLEGRSFAGWATNATGEIVYLDCAVVSNLTTAADDVITLFAQWTTNAYTVTFDANGGEGGKTVTQDYGTALAAPTVTRTGYTFDGWSPSVPSTVPAENVTYTAQWRVNQYAVTFNANGGTGGWSRSMDYGASVSAPTVSRTGYTFVGWSPAVLATVPADDATYTAQWTINQYTVTFNANGGMGGKTVTQDYGTALAAPTVTREGYTFVGWSPSVPSTVPAGNTTYSAQWTVNQYTVTFDANGGTGGKTVTQNYGTALAAPTVSCMGYTFDGWSPFVPATVPAGNAKYTAQWKVNRYTVTFNANGGTGGKMVTQDYGTALSAPTVSRTGYTFNGWSPSVPSTVPVGNTTYTAQWKANQYTVTFNANGGTGGKTVTQDYGTALAAPTVTRTGYTFDGWSPSVPSTVPAGNATYTAQWKVNRYMVTFNANGGTGGKTVTQNYGTVLSAPTVSRTGYTFNGWSPSVPATVPAGNATYTAQWKANKYTVTFNANGGAGEMADQVFTYGVAAPLATSTFHIADCKVFGWAMEPDGDVVFADGESVSNLTAVAGGSVTLYAQWTPWDVAFADGGVAVDEGGHAVVRVVGGSADKASSVKVYLTWNTAVAADVNLANAQAASSTGLKFPLTLKWAKGEIGEKVITIPVKADALVEGEEFFTLQLAAANGVEMGGRTVCTVRIADAQWNENDVEAATSAALPAGATAVKDAADTVTGYFTKKDKKGNVTAKAMPGYIFTGWYDAKGKKVGSKAALADKTRKSKKATPRFAVAHYLRGLADPANGGKVTGSGKYAEKKSVTLKATPNKYWTFEGWYRENEEVTVNSEQVGGIGEFVTKSTTVKMTVTNDATYLAMFKPYPKVTVAIDNKSGGTVKGAGSYLAGKTVTLTATPKKGYAFCGWFDVEGNLVSLNASYKYKVTADGLALQASFKKESALAKPELTWGGETNLTVGVSYSAKLTVKGESVVSITKVTGLPKGLTFKSGKVTGVPTVAKAVTAKVTVALKSNAKKTWTYSVKLNVAALQTWAVGTFKGTLYDGSDESVASPKGTVTLTVGKTGKVSGKFVDTKKKAYSFTASSFKTYDEDGVLRTKATMKYGTKSVAVEIAVGSEEKPGEAGATTLVGIAEVGSSNAPFSGQSAILTK